MYKTYIIFILISCLLAVSCNRYKSEKHQKMSKKDKFIGNNLIEDVEKELIKKYSTADTFRIKKGVRQVATFWTENDGSIDEYKNFCMDNFIDSKDELAKAFNKISRNMEVLSGNMNRITMDLKSPLDLDVGEINKIDMMFGSYSPASHLQEDFYKNKIAFIYC